jgi:hypothetical protein
MANMRKKKLTEQEIDEIVASEADDITKWEDPISVKPEGAISIRLSTDTIRKAKYLAKLHKYRGYQTWLKRIIEDRIKTEEEILNGLKQDLESESSG